MINESGADAFAESAERAQDQATKYAQKAVEAIDSRRKSAASGLENAAASIHAKADELPGGETVSGLAHQTADKLNETAGYLRDHDMKDMAADVDRFVRAYPLQAIMGAVVFGFLAGRAVRR